MDVFVIPIARDRYELYCEPSSEVDAAADGIPATGLFGRLRARFGVMLRAAEERHRREAVPDDPLDHQVGNYAREFELYAGIDGISPADVLRWATANPGELLADSADPVGVIAPGALADLILVDGDPLADLGLLARPAQSLRAVIRDGAFVIDRMPQELRLAAE